MRSLNSREQRELRPSEIIRPPPMDTLKENDREEAVGVGMISMGTSPERDPELAVPERALLLAATTTSTEAAKAEGQKIFKRHECENVIESLYVCIPRYDLDASGTLNSWEEVQLPAAGRALQPERPSFMMTLALTLS